MDWREAFNPLIPMGPTHLHPHPTPKSNILLFHSSSDPHPSASLCYPLGGCNQTSVTPGPQQLGFSLSPITLQTFFSHHFVPSAAFPHWHNSLCATFCFKGQEFAKEMLAERVQYSPFYLKSPVSLISI